MKILSTLKSNILKYPILFWVVTLTYVVSVVILILNKREVNATIFFISYTIEGIGLAIYYKFYASENQKNFTKHWLKVVFTLPKKRIKNNNHSKNILHIILFFSSWGTTFGCLALLICLFKFSWLISFAFFIFQLTASVVVLGMYIGSSKLTKIRDNVYFVAILSFTFVLLDYISQIIGRSLVTVGIAVSPELVPTITKGLCWFSFIFLVSIFIQFLGLLWFRAARNKKLALKVSIITYLFLSVTAVLPYHLLQINALSLVDEILTYTYTADTVNYFKCNNKIIKNVPNDTARYLKVDEQEFRSFYFEKNKKNIYLTTYICNGSDYNKVNIHQ